MGVMDSLIEKAKIHKKTIILPEATDERILKATEEILKQEIANIVLIGDKNNILKLANEKNINIDGARIENPLTSEYVDEAIKTFYELRKEKGITLDDARKYMQDEIYFGIMLVKMGKADGLVSGAIHPTADTLRPALQIIKGKEKSGVVSSFFLMEIENSDYEKAYIFADCGLIPYPNEEELATISIQANESYKSIIGGVPKIALLSYSTFGSAKSDNIDRIVRAKEIIKQKDPDIIVDGELQLDAAIDEKVAKIKAPGSEVAGKANVLIFPNLDAGNIGYKLVERFAKAKAYGPITQGLAAPINDLSRGCKYMDIVGVVAITCIQAEDK